MPDDEIPPARTVEWHPTRTRPPRGRQPLVVAGYAVVVAGIIVAQILVSKAYSATPSTTATPAPTDTRQPAPARVPGWHAVVSDTGTLAYDVPPDWQGSAIGAGRQLRDGGAQLAMTMLAGPPNDRCTGSGAATVPAPNTAADTARHVANAIYGPGNVRVDAARKVTDDGITGDLVTAHANGCGSTDALVDVFALPDPANHRSVVLIAFGADQHDLDTIVTSVRQLSAH